MSWQQLLLVSALATATASATADPHHAAVAYAPADPPASQGHLLDIYLPDQAERPAPVVLWSAGSAWLADTGRMRADWLVDTLVPLGYAVIGVSVRSSAQAIFPAQLEDIKAAIAFIKTNAGRYHLDPDRIAVTGTSSGGWVAAMAAATEPTPETAIRAAVAFWPPTNFVTMDAWAIAPCDQIVFRGQTGFCHDHPSSPESRLVGCAIQACPETVAAASPITHVGDHSAPILIVHGGSDPLVPHNQGESLYQAYNKACNDAVFVSVPLLGHGPLARLMTDPGLVAGATTRSTAKAGCVVAHPKPHNFGARTVIDFLDRHLRAD